MNPKTTNTIALTLILAMMAAYTIVFSCASIMRWASFNSSMDDMGIMIQTLHNTSQGELLVESVNLGVPLSRLWLAHLEFIYIPLALIYKLIHRPETLLVLQALFLALGALPVYWLARDRLKSQVAGIVFAAAYLFYPAMHNANLFDVHGIVFSTSLLLYMFYFLDRVFREKESGFSKSQTNRHCEASSTKQSPASSEGTASFLAVTARGDSKDTSSSKQSADFERKPRRSLRRRRLVMTPRATPVGLFFLFAFFALLCREDIAVTLGMVGLYIFFIRKNYKLGVITGMVGAVWFGTFYFVRPMLVDYFNVVDPAILADITRPSHWAHLDGGRLILERPLFFLDEYFLTGLNAKYIFWLLAPVAFLSFASPSTLAIAAPILLINMTSGWLPTHLIEYQYTATITPVVFVSAIYGLENIRKYLTKKDFSTAALQKFNIACMILIVLFAFGTGVAKSNLKRLSDWQVTPRHETISRIAKIIPEGASLCADMVLGTHAAERYEMYAFPDNYKIADYVFYDLSRRRIRLMSRASVFLSNAMPVNDYILELLNSPAHGVVHYEDGIILIEKGYPHEPGVKNLAVAQQDEIGTIVEQPVDPAQAGLVFAGYTRHDDVEYDDSTSYAHFTLYWKKSARHSERRDESQIVQDQKLEILLPKLRDQNDKSRFLQKGSKQYILDSGTARRELPWRPAFGLYPVEKWQPGEIIREEVYWENTHGQVKVGVTTSGGSRIVELFRY